MLAVKFDLQKAPPDLNELLTLVKNGTEVVLFEGDIAIARIVPILICSIPICSRLSGWPMTLTRLSRVNPGLV